MSERANEIGPQGGSAKVSALPPSAARIVTPAADAEAEAMRRQLLAEYGEMQEQPGDMDSLLDRAYLSDDTFEEHVLKHPACLRSPELFRAAWAVAGALADFYQLVGQEAAKGPVADGSAGADSGANL